MKNKEVKNKRIYVRVSQREKDLLTRFLALENKRQNTNINLSQFLLFSAMEKAKKTYRKQKENYSNLYVQQPLFE